MDLVSYPAQADWLVNMEYTYLRLSEIHELIVGSPSLKRLKYLMNPIYSDNQNKETIIMIIQKFYLGCKNLDNSFWDCTPNLKGKFSD